MKTGDNVISVKLPSKDLAAAKQKLKELKALLSPHLISLTPNERQILPKMRDKTAPFVEKAMNYAEVRPNFTPPYLDVEELKVDVKAVNDLNQVYREVEQLCSSLDDTIMLSGSEAYTAALTYYHSVKQAAKINVPDAKAIYEDLRQRFER